MNHYIPLTHTCAYIGIYLNRFSRKLYRPIAEGCGFVSHNSIITRILITLVRVSTPQFFQNAPDAYYFEKPVHRLMSPFPVKNENHRIQTAPNRGISGGARERGVHNFGRPGG